MARKNPSCGQLIFSFGVVIICFGIAENAGTIDIVPNLTQTQFQNLIETIFIVGITSVSLFIAIPLFGWFIYRQLQKRERHIAYQKSLQQYQDQRRKEYLIDLVKIEDIDTMTGEAFEQAVGQLFEDLGLFKKIEFTPKTGDFGADLIGYETGKKTAIQCKRQSKNVGVKAVQQVMGGAQYYNCDSMLVITNQFFTKSAIELAHKSNIQLIDREKLGTLIEENGGLYNRSYELDRSFDFLFEDFDDYTLHNQ